MSSFLNGCGCDGAVWNEILNCEGKISSENCPHLNVQNKNIFGQFAICFAVFLFCLSKSCANAAIIVIKLILWKRREKKVEEKPV